MKLIFKSSLLLALLAGFFASAAWAASPTCNAAAGETKLRWPSVGTPTWELCWVPPRRVRNGFPADLPGSSGPQGSGLEIRNAYYRGVMAVKRAHAPMLFAEYTTSTCYRDWKDESEGFAVEPAARNQLREAPPTRFFATTTCDVSTHPVNSYGACPWNGNPVFNGAPGSVNAPLTAADCATTSNQQSSTVAIEQSDRGTFVQLTTNHQAAWYKYATRLRFFNDGSIGAEFGFGNNNGTNNSISHWHHQYWRFDFDIDGAAGDQLISNNVLRIGEFQMLRKDGATTNTLKIVDQRTGFGYEMVPGANDDLAPANMSGRNLHRTDVIGTLYKANELTDRGNVNNLGDCEMQSTNLITPVEDITNADTVVYYRASANDKTGVDSMICKRVGPTFAAIGDWPIFRGDFE